MKAARNRNETYGTTGLTLREKLVRLARTYPAMHFLKHQEYEEGFTSATGAARSRHGLVFRDGQGGLLLFSAAEVKILEELGVEMPPKILKTKRSNKVRRGLSGQITPGYLDVSE